MSATDRLTLAQWLSPGFPVGAFAYSHGLEWAIGAGEVRDAATLAEWLSDLLGFGAGRTDAVLVAAAMRGEDADDLAALAAALAPSRERWAETTAQGRAFAETVAGIDGAAARPLPYPVAVGTAARRLSLPVAEVAALWLQAFAANLVSVAVRAVPLGQTEGQRVLAGLAPLIARLADEAATARVADIATAAPRADLAAMRHETQDVRLYRT